MDFPTPVAQLLEERRRDLEYRNKIQAAILELRFWAADEFFVGISRIKVGKIEKVIERMKKDLYEKSCKI